MSVEEMKAVYLALKDSGDLEKMFPGLSGEWEKDKKTFTTEYNKNEMILGDIDIDDFEEDFDNYF